MKKNLFTKLFAVTACCALSVSLLVGCGGSDEKSSSSKTETKTETSSSSEATSSEASSSSEATSSEASSSSEATSSETSSEFNVQDLEPYCSYSYMGISNEYEHITYYLTFNEDSTEAIFCLLNSDSKEYALYVGATEYTEDADGNTFVKISNDDGSAYNLAYVYDEEEDVYYLDLGSEIGTGTVAECEASEVLDAIGKIVENGKYVELA